MKIAFVNDTFLYGRGVDQVIFEIAQRLGKHHDVSVITSIADFPEKNFKIVKVNGKKLVTGSWKDFLGFFHIFKYRKFTKMFDVVNLHHTTLAFAFLGKKNVIPTYNGNPPAVGENALRKFFRNAANRINRSLLRFFKKIIVISEFAKKELVKTKVPEDKIEVIYYAAGEEFKKIKLRNDKGYIFFIGRHESHKRINEVIKLSKNLNFKTKIAGLGPETEKLKAYAKKINAPVEFLGRVSQKEKIRLYEDCSFFVSASMWEDFGLIFIEAAKCGKTSIAYNVGSIPEVIQHNKTGFLAKNFEEFENYAKILIENKKLRGSMGANALKFSKKFDWEITCKKYEKSLKSQLHI